MGSSERGVSSSCITSEVPEGYNTAGNHLLSPHVTVATSGWRSLSLLGISGTSGSQTSPPNHKELHSPCFSSRFTDPGSLEKAFHRLLVFPFLFFLNAALFFFPFLPCDCIGRTPKHNHRLAETKGHEKNLPFSSSLGNSFEICHQASQALPQMVDHSR